HQPVDACVPFLVLDEAGPPARAVVVALEAPEMDDLVEVPHVRREIAEQVAQDLAVNGEPVLLVDAQELADLPGIEAIDPLLDDHPVPPASAPARGSMQYLYTI